MLYCSHCCLSPFPCLPLRILLLLPCPLSRPPLVLSRRYLARTSLCFLFPALPPPAALVASLRFLLLLRPTLVWGVSCVPAVWVAEWVFVQIRGSVSAGCGCMVSPHRTSLLGADHWVVYLLNLSKIRNRSSFCTRASPEAVHFSQSSARTPFNDIYVIYSHEYKWTRT